MRTVTGLLFLIPLGAWAAAPMLTELEPRGAQRGKSFTLTLDGKNLAEGAQLLSNLPATFTPLTPPQENMAAGRKLPFLVELKADATIGSYPIRVQTPDGISNVLLFTVGAFPEVTEAESKPDSHEHANDSIETAERIEAPVTINGTLRGPDRDYYRIHGKQGDRLVFEVEARRIGSAIDPVLSIADGSGKQVAHSDDGPAIGVDSRIDFTFPREGDYYAVVHDARFSQQTQNFYRLKVGNFSYADGIFPLGWKRGEKAEVEFFGGSFAAPLKTTADLSGVSQKSQFLRVNVPGEAGSLPFLFVVGDLPEKLAPTHAPDEAVTLEPATVMNGRISKAGAVDRYKLAVSPGDHWQLELRARGLGTSRLDGVLTINDAKGKKLASAGDKPPREDVFSLLSAGRTSSDPWLDFTVPKDVGEVVVTVEDLLRRGGPGFAYRLVARKQPADFTLTVSDPYVNIPAKGTVTVGVSVNRHGFKGPVEVSIPDIGNDFTVQGGHIPGEWKEDAYYISRNGTLTITAKPDAKPKKLAEFAIWGEGKAEDGTVVRRRAQCLGMITDVAGGTGIADAEGRENQNPFVAPWLGFDLPAVVTVEQPADLKLSAPRALRLVQGTGYELTWEFQPRVPETKPPETVGADMAAPPAAEIQVRRAKAGQKEEKYLAKGSFNIFTTTRTPPEKFDLLISGQSGMEESEEAGLVAPAVTIEIVQGYDVAPPKEPVTLQQGGKAELVGAFRREPEFAAPVTVAAEYLPAHVTCQPVEVRTASEYRMTCEADASAKPGSYEVQLTPASVVTGLDKREMPYKVAPVTAKLIISENRTQAAR
jgi:hypothetical protein